jgi:hypothetical protein
MRLSNIITNLVPYTRLHFTTVSYAPIVPLNEEPAQPPTASELTDMVFDPRYATIDCSPLQDVLIACGLIYRGM